MLQRIRTVERDGGAGRRAEHLLRQPAVRPGGRSGAAECLGKLLALTSNEEITLTALKFSRIFGSSNVYQLMPHHQTGTAATWAAASAAANCSPVTPPSMTCALLDQGASIVETKITEEFNLGNYRKLYGRDFVRCSPRQQRRDAATQNSSLPRRRRWSPCAAPPRRVNPGLLGTSGSVFDLVTVVTEAVLGTFAMNDTGHGHCQRAEQRLHAVFLEAAHGCMSYMPRRPASGQGDERLHPGPVAHLSRFHLAEALRMPAARWRLPRRPCKGDLFRLSNTCWPSPKRC